MTNDELAIFKEQNETIERLQKEMERQRLDVAGFRRERNDAMREKSKAYEELDAEKAKNAKLVEALANIAVVLEDPALAELVDDPGDGEPEPEPEHAAPRPISPRVFACKGCGKEQPLGWEDGYCGACFAGKAAGPMEIFRG